MPDEVGTFDQFETDLSAWVPRFNKARAAARYEERAFLESGLINARRQATHLAAATAVRIIDLGSGLIVVVNAERQHAAFAVARSLVETLAIFSYIRQNVLPYVRKGRADQVTEALKRLRLGLDPGINFSRKNPVSPMPVSSVIKALCTQTDETLDGDEEETAGQTMRQLYSSLSDHSHPNFSAGHLSSYFDDEGMMDWDIDSEWTTGSLHEVLGTNILAMHFAGEAFDELLTTLRDHPLVLVDKRED